MQPLIVIFLILAFLLPLLLYLWWFFGAPFSDSITDWGAFGAYFSGTTGTALLLIISYIAWTLEDRLTRHSLRIQQVISLNELRHRELQDISRKLHSVFHIAAANDISAIADIARIESEVSSFCDVSRHLFPKTKDANFPTALINSMGNLRKSLAQGGNDGTLYHSFVTARTEFLTALREDLLKSIDAAHIEEKNA